MQLVRAANQQRDNINSKVRAIRNGDYNTVAPGLFNDSEFDEPLVANLIDTTARDIAEVMSPLPAFNCQSASLNSNSDQKRQDLREAIANSYVQHSRLQNQMFDGADFYGSYGFMAYMVEPDFDSQMPCIYVDNSLNAYYALDGLGRRPGRHPFAPWPAGLSEPRPAEVRPAGRLAHARGHRIDLRPDPRRLR